MIVRELLTRLGFSVDQSKLAGYNGAINNIKDRAKEAQDSVAGIFSAFAAFASLKSIGKTADEMQSLEARIGMLPQTIGSAGDAFDEVAARATAARSSIEAYGSFYVKMQNAGKDYVKTQADGLKITDTLAKSLVVGGASTQERASALLQFGQAIGSGVLQGDELRAMAEAAPQFMDELAVAIGKPRSELKKMGSEGKLTSKMVIEAVLKMSSVFDEKFKNMPINIGASMTIIGNRWSMFINKLNRDSMAVTKVSNFFLKTFDKIEGGLDAMVDFFGGATNTMKFFGIAMVAAFTPLVGSWIIGGIMTALSPIGLFVIALASIGLALEDVYQWMTGGESIIGSFFGEFSSFAPIIAKVKGYFDALLSGNILGKFIAMAIKIKDYLYDAIPFQKIANSLMAIAGYAMNIFFGIIDVIVGAFKVLIGFLTGDFDLLFNGIKQIFSGVGDVIFSTVGIILNAVYLAIDLIKTYFKIAYGAIGTIIFDSIFGNIKGAALKGFEYLKSLVGMGSSSATAGVSPQAAASSASPSFASTNKAPSGMSQNIITINQTLPAGTAQETAAAARSATMDAGGDAFNAMARKAGQAS